MLQITTIGQTLPSAELDRYRYCLDAFISNLIKNILFFFLLFPLKYSLYKDQLSINILKKSNLKCHGVHATCIIFIVNT